MATFTTETGSVYELDNAHLRVRRVPKFRGNTMRGDGDWKALLAPVTLTVGTSAVMVLEPLDPAASVTVRRTSPVQEITP
jgi:hypothetical protein